MNFITNFKYNVREFSYIVAGWRPLKILTLQYWIKQTMNLSYASNCF